MKNDYKKQIHVFKIVKVVSEWAIVPFLFFFRDCLYVCRSTNENRKFANDIDKASESSKSHRA
ncbi:hypothetical protein CEH05_00930 [Halobacillus halophilus]|uniref:Uncharacterized protein n=1 Tax=Halobacillus halophilus (strain ATCC 35676 / DSM 2266 / JCM 20832 / KCTC 3685 / LMG 17431 / NBRC 102448 / NCIMB 2269) TaxID=866895 RepID=I0JHD0_HALH3|nr:hypothetical protein [Halobacillus halophilus]ASF37771.1 hypothetical protein CEH05_00930 [Halobacillus halophilus]CCG43548.1 hypothetical protein HBHAL_1167 [Halobacillus halophilus DSM 2266]